MLQSVAQHALAPDGFASLRSARRSLHLSR
jgi:hypothetical protein